jgi:hypothetical protein
MEVDLTLSIGGRQLNKNSNMQWHNQPN